LIALREMNPEYFHLFSLFLKDTLNPSNESGEMIYLEDLLGYLESGDYPVAFLNPDELEYHDPINDTFWKMYREFIIKEKKGAPPQQGRNKSFGLFPIRNNEILYSKIVKNRGNYPFHFTRP
jgi:hypothetical protein